jgi:hypothetical protein
VPFSVVASNGTVAHFVPDGVCDGPGGAVDFESFVLPAGFENVESVLFVHTEAGTFYDSFFLDALEVRFDGPESLPLVTAPVGVPRPARVPGPNSLDPLRAR